MCEILLAGRDLQTRNILTGHCHVLSIFFHILVSSSSGSPPVGSQVPDVSVSPTCQIAVVASRWPAASKSIVLVSSFVAPRLLLDLGCQLDMPDRNMCRECELFKV